MTPGRKIEAGELFLRFYRKRISSFLVTIYKAGITGRDKDIHKLRVDVKKVIALFSFFEMLQFSGFSIKKNTRQLRDIFRQAGKIREIQINLLRIEKYKNLKSSVASFKKFLKKEQKKYIKAFIQAIAAFDEQKLKIVNKKVKEYCHVIDSEVVMKKSGVFMLERAGLIKLLAEHPENIDNIHKIRTELKKMGAITSLLLQVTPVPLIKQLNSKLGQTEVQIGEWHDWIILTETLEQYIKSGSENDPRCVEELFRFKELIVNENSERLKKILPEINEITNLIEQKTFQNQT